MAKALHQVLEATTPQSRSVRLQLIRPLADIESQTVGIAMPKAVAIADNFIGTAQAAELLGYSRPYVAMLIDQKNSWGRLCPQVVFGVFPVPPCWPGKPKNGDRR